LLDAILPGLSSAQNVHPMFVHFPIVLWLSALLFWGLALVLRRTALWDVGRWLVYLALLGAVVAVGSGLWAAEHLGHDSPGHELVHVHRNWMLVTSGFGLVTATAAFVSRKKTLASVRWLLFTLLLLTSILTTLGADRGALLVFRYGIGTLGEVPPGTDDTHAHDHEH
jgi:uncharacterized membrane protein